MSVILRPRLDKRSKKTAPFEPDDGPPPSHRHRVKAKLRGNSMTTLARPPSGRIIGYMLAVAVLAIAAIAQITVTASWLSGEQSMAPRIDIAALLSSTDITNLPLLQVEQPF